MAMGGRGGGAPGNANRSESSASITATPVQDLSVAQVAQVIQDLGRENNAFWIDLPAFRERIGGTREQQDAMMMRLARAGEIRLIPEENQKTITARDRAASINVSGEEKHLIGLNQRPGR